MTQEINNDEVKPRMYDSIFWIEVEKIKPNPYQPRREFDEARLRELADSIRQYGVLQPLVVTRKEFEKEDGGLGVEYELISGERRLRASILAGVKQVPTVIRTGHDDNRVKLELAIIENLQREDLNPIDRARAFGQLVDEFGLKHADVGKKVGRSREYVSNTIRLLSLPQEILDAIATGKISEGHSRPILMLADKPEEQIVLFKEVLYKKLTVREAESIARRIAYDRVRKKEYIQDPEIVDLEEKFTAKLGTRVRIEKKQDGGKMVIDFFTNDDLRGMLELMHLGATKTATSLMDKFVENQRKSNPDFGKEPAPITVEQAIADIAIENAIQEPAPTAEVPATFSIEVAEIVPEVFDTREEAIVMNDKSPEEIRKEENVDDEDLYSVSGFSI